MSYLTKLDQWWFDSVNLLEVITHPCGIIKWLVHGRINESHCYMGMWLPILALTRMLPKQASIDKKTIYAIIWKNCFNNDIVFFLLFVVTFFMWSGSIENVSRPAFRHVLNECVFELLFIDIDNATLFIHWYIHQSHLKPNCHCQSHNIGYKN